MLELSVPTSNNGRLIPVKVHLIAVQAAMQLSDYRDEKSVSRP